MKEAQYLIDHTLIRHWGFGLQEAGDSDLKTKEIIVLSLSLS